MKLTLEYSCNPLQQNQAEKGEYMNEDEKERLRERNGFRLVKRDAVSR